MEREPLSAVIKSAVRRRIIMHNDSKNLVIHEGKLAQEFGVSRTPVRQVIQSLAAERMVEVLSGVGTIAAPLGGARKTKDMRAFWSILKACSECTIDGNVNLILVEISSLRMFLEQSQDADPSEIFFDVANKFISSLVQVVEDSILRDALIACYWRYLRRRLAEHQGDFGLAINEMIDLIKGAEYGAREGDAERLLLMVGVNVEECIKASKGT